MELIDTVELMNSKDYIDRFKAEYYQLDIRIKKLKIFLSKYRKNELDFTASCSYSLLYRQYKIMLYYKEYLLQRSVIENIDL